MEYTIISFATAKGVADEVTKRLKDGWVLHEGLVVALSSERGKDVYAQAMTKKEPGDWSQKDLQV